MTIGIYLGTPKYEILDSVYIGQSSDIEGRVRRHNSYLQAGTHSEKLQKAYDKYGIFDWEILTECSKEEVHVKEKYYINLFNSVSEGFNTYEDSSSAPIKYGLNNGNTHIDNISVYKCILDNTIKYPNASKKEISTLSNATIDEVNGLWYATRYKWLIDFYPEEYTKVLSLVGSRTIGGPSAYIRGIVYPTIISPELITYSVDNVRKFASTHDLDKGDLNNVLNIKVASVKGWIIKDLDILNLPMHNKFYATNRGSYRCQFDLYTNTYR